MRQAREERKTKETSIKITWKLDGTGKHQIKTSIPFMDHMLELFSRHGYFDLKVDAYGDTDIDAHHTVEDLGIVLGSVFKNALGDKKSINRYGFQVLPMDESLALISLDISNRPYLDFNVKFKSSLQNFDKALVKEFFSAFVNHAGITLHIRMLSGDNTHHMIEAIFKAFAKALRSAIEVNTREKGIPSTKGVI